MGKTQLTSCSREQISLEAKSLSLSLAFVNSIFSEIAEGSKTGETVEAASASSSKVEVLMLVPKSSSNAREKFNVDLALLWQGGHFISSGDGIRNTSL